MSTESEIFLLEAFDLVSGTTTIGVIYGIVLTLYCICTWSLYPQLQMPDKRRHAMFSLGYISLLLFCATGLLSGNGRMIQLAYTNHADFPGAPYAYEVSRNSTNIPLIAMGGILDFIIEVLTMAIQIRRLWIIWSGTKYAVAVTILPLLLLLSYIALGTIQNIVATFVPYDQLGIHLRIEVAMEVAAYGGMAAFTTLVTGLIAVRLLLVRKQHMKLMGTSEAASPYLSIVAMLVEPYFLDAAWSLTTAISFATKSPSLLMLLSNDSIIKIIALFLVVYRVETGRGWTKQTEEKLTSLQWNHGPQTQTASDGISDVQSRVPATTSDQSYSPPTAHSDSLAV